MDSGRDREEDETEKKTFIVIKQGLNVVWQTHVGKNGGGGCGRRRWRRRVRTTTTTMMKVFFKAKRGWVGRRNTPQTSGLH
jgi:hypothetical protein